LIGEYHLDLDVTLVTSECNLADALIRVPQKWFGKLNGKKSPIPEIFGAAAGALAAEQIAEIHHSTGHYDDASIRSFKMLFAGSHHL